MIFVGPFQLGIFCVSLCRKADAGSKVPLLFLIAAPKSLCWPTSAAEFHQRPLKKPQNILRKLAYSTLYNSDG